MTLPRGASCRNSRRNSSTTRHAWVGLVRGACRRADGGAAHEVRPPAASPPARRRSAAALVPLNRRNIYHRDGNMCQYCGKQLPDQRAVAGPRDSAVARRRRHVGKPRLRLHQLQRQKGRQDAAEAGMRLIRTPRSLKTPAQLIRVQHASWAQFVDEAYWNVELK